jgi:competence protein ComEA
MLVTVAIVLAFVFVGICAAGETEKININTDPVEKLMQLDRVGPKYAQRIIEYREKYGPFERPEDITKVPGIGNKTWLANKDRIVI